MKLLVTGASGLIGRHVCALAAADEAIELVASARRRPPGLSPNTGFVAADLSSAEAGAGLVRSVRPTHVIHTAWETRHPTYWEDSSNLDWLASTTAMAEAFAAVGGLRFVQLGTCAEYDWAFGTCVEYETPSQPATAYGKAKLAAFEAIEAASRDSFEAADARIFSVFGPGENPARFIPTICRSHIGGVVPELGSGLQQRDLLYAKDAAAALLALAASRGTTGVINIGAGEATPLGEVARILAGLAGASETGLGRRPDRPDEPALLVPSTQRIRAIDWKPAYSLEVGLDETFRWWRDQLVA